jgi:histidinol-phosphate phosphatase family protein
MNRALFLDLDGTLIKTVSKKKFPVDEYDWEFNQSLMPTIHLAKQNGLMLVIVTNQGGIDSGYVSETAFNEKMVAIMTGLSTLTGYIFGKDMRFYYCRSNDKGNYDRKPNPGMAYQAALDMELDLRSSVMIGDASGKQGDFSADDFNFYRRSGIGRYVDVREASSYENMFMMLVKKDRKTFLDNKESKDFFDATIGE